MCLKNWLLTTGALAAAIVAGCVNAGAQGPLYDKVVVDLPYAVTIENTVLQPGNYVIRQMDDADSNSRILMIFADNGMKLKATTLAIPALDNDTPDRTTVTLHRYGNDYYFDKVWLQGKNYGYEFPLPPAVKARQLEATQPYTVAATYEPTARNEEAVEVATAAPAPDVAPAPEPAPIPEQIAQYTPPPFIALAPAPTPAPVMPQTADNWLSLVLAGSMLAAAGMLLRKVHA